MAGSNLMNKVWNFFGIEQDEDDEEIENYDEEYEQEEGEEEEERKLFGRKNKVVNMPQTNQVKMVISQPTNIEQSEEIRQ